MRIRFSLLIFIFIQFTSSAFSQEKSIDVEIEWQEIQSFNFAEGESVQSLSFKNAMLSQGQQPMPIWSINFNVPNNVSDLDVNLIDPVFENLSPKESALLDLSLLSEKLKIEKGVSIRRYQHIGVVSFFPFEKDEATGAWSKLISAKININYSLSISNANRQFNRSFASNSVLASGSGDWFKVGVVKNGIFKVSYEYLQNNGAISSSVASNSINVFGNSFGLLPENNSFYRPDDLMQNAIEMMDGGDGTFDPGDYFLFYAQAAYQWGYLLSGSYTRTKHMYCDTSYYFVNINPLSVSPKRVNTVASSTSSPTHTISTFDEMQFLESEATNFIKSGREWYGEMFDFNLTSTYVFNFTNLDVTQNATVKADMAAKTPGSGSSSFTISILGSSANMNISIPGVGSGTYTAAANAGIQSISFLPNGNSVRVQVTFNKFSSSAQGWTNYLEVVAKRYLIADGTPMEFRNPTSIGAGNVTEYLVSSTDPGLVIWEITDPTTCSEIQTTFASNIYSFVKESDSLREYIAFTPAEVNTTPIFISRVQHQDLHSLSAAELIIITHPEFIGPSNQLSQFHSSEGITNHVVTTTQVYNEFSSGMKDATAIKQFLKMFYDRSGGDTSLIPKYVLLVGDGSYNNKDGQSGNTSYIPTYQSVNSTYVTISFVSDDYFVMLDPNENMNNSDQLDMAIGRLPVQSSTEAQSIVNKIIAYNTNTGSLATTNTPDCCNDAQQFSMGDWRNNFTYIADDQDFNAYIDASEIFADTLKQNNPFINIDKLYLDAYLQVSTPGGERYPDISAAISDRVEKGALVINYIGHGGEVGWAHERILDVTTINEWNNSPRLPLFMTATCEFSRFDDPARTSAGEFVLLNPNGGGIALLTTTRLVYSGPNEILNDHFNDCVLDRINGNALRIGDIFTLTKNNTIAQIATSNTRNFTLLGDPAVRLRMPHHQVIADSVNSAVIGSGTDTLKALSQITISGHVQDYLGNVLTGFNGIVYPTVYDKEQILYSLGNDPESSVRSFDLRKNVIYKGKATVVNGYFTFSFVVPKDINFQFGPGKLSFYAQNGSDDAAGGDFNVTVGGFNTNAANDTDGPVIELYMNDENFVSGGITDESPHMYAKVSDLNGVNTVGTGIGHDIIAILDGNTANPVVLNDSYQSDINTFQSGMVTHQFQNIEEGIHTLKFKIWDVYNNSSDAEIEFVVAKAAEVALDHVLNYPNPFTTRTQFFFEHNQSCNSLNVQIQVFTVSGKLVKTIHEEVPTEGYRITPIEWDGKDDFGDRLAIGTYIYRVKVKTDDGQIIEKFEKLVILN